jgi:CHAD domain-containing protein
MAKAREIPGLAAEMPFADAAARTVRIRAEELFDSAENVLDTDDIERVHDMRVASRRLRAVLEIYAPCFPKDAHGEVLRDVKLLADALGARRDPDVQLAAVDALRAAMTEAEAPGLDLFAGGLGAEQVAGNETLAAALADAADNDLHRRLVALTETVS